MLYDHIIFWNILEWVYGHDSRENELLVNPGQHQYCRRTIEHHLEPAELMRLTSTTEERMCAFASGLHDQWSPSPMNMWDNSDGLSCDPAERATDVTP
jgi:hypothetical protein